MLSANDRSRWATVHALVDDGTYVIGVREGTDEGGFSQEDTRPSFFQLEHTYENS
jgi:hypothetical protein